MPSSVRSRSCRCCPRCCLGALSSCHSPPIHACAVPLARISIGLVERPLVLIGPVRVQLFPLRISSFYGFLLVLGREPKKLPGSGERRFHPSSSSEVANEKPRPFGIVC